MSTFLHTEAIVLNSLPFKDYDRILTLFSAQGILKIFVKVLKKNYLHYSALTSPLTRAEFQYIPGKKDLHRFSEGKILSQNIKIRDSYETLIAAEIMVQAISRSQWQGKPAPRLYQLFSLFLEALPKSSDPATFAASFLIKVLAHEGVLQIAKPSATVRFGGEIYTNMYPKDAVRFSLEEETLFQEMIHCRSLDQLQSMKTPIEFHSKVSTLFEQAVTE